MFYMWMKTWRFMGQGRRFLVNILKKTYLLRSPCPQKFHCWQEKFRLACGKQNKRSQFQKEDNNSQKLSKLTVVRLVEGWIIYVIF